MFWKIVQPFSSGEVNSSEKITLIEEDEIIGNNGDTARVLNTFFSNIVSNLKIPEYTKCDPISEINSDSVLKSIMKYRNHPSILKIGEVCHGSNANFSFSSVQRTQILNEITQLNSSTSGQSIDIPTKIIKENSDIFADFILTSFNLSVANSIFPSSLKNKKGDINLKDNYIPVSILSNISKIFERCMFQQISKFMEPLLSKYQCGFRKGYNTQYCLLAMLEKWKSSVDKGSSFGALLTDLSKAFDCLSHKLLIAKLHAYGFSLNALRLVHSYLTNRKQRTKINNKYSSREEILFGVPQGSILGPLLFDIFRFDVFFIMNETEFASYTDDNTPYTSSQNVDNVIRTLVNDSVSLFKWFSNNQMKTNKDKYHLLSNKERVTMKIVETEIKSSNCEKLLGIKIDSNLIFNEHLNNIICKTSHKTNALFRVAPYVNESKKRILINSFFWSQFSYCPLMWMFHSHTPNNKINRLHERCLRIVYNDKKSTYEKIRDNLSQYT